MKQVIYAFLISVLFASPTLAHSGISEASAFTAGIMHPLSGADHLLAMIAVGLWAALRGQNALWLWPLAFVSSMIAGGALGMNGFALPFVEQGILASILALGLVTAAGFRAPMALGAAMISGAGLLHGYAHGLEAPTSGSRLQYAAGFVLATALLHGAGIGFAALATRIDKPMLVHAAGSLIMLAGFTLIFVGA